MKILPWALLLLLVGYNFYERGQNANTIRRVEGELKSQKATFDSVQKARNAVIQGLTDTLSSQRKAVRRADNEVAKADARADSIFAKIKHHDNDDRISHEEVTKIIEVKDEQIKTRDVTIRLRDDQLVSLTKLRVQDSLKLEDRDRMILYLHGQVSSLAKVKRNRFDKVSLAYGFAMGMALVLLGK